MNKRALKTDSFEGMGFGFEKPNDGAKNEWLTPPAIIRYLGAFDLDPCSPIERPWDTADRHLTIEDDGLKADWGGRCWLNPPYGPQTGQWMRRMAEHGNGVALIFARTETETFERWIWPFASGYFFIARRLRFHHVDGRQGDSATAPSVLISFDSEVSGGRNFEALRNFPMKGGLFGPTVKR